MGTAVGVFTLTSANGDMLFLDMVGHLNPADFSETPMTFTVTGGTGRFEDVSGAFLADIHLAYAVNLGVSPDPYTAVLSGSLSFADSEEEDQE